MTVNKVRHESRTILDLSKKDLNKNKISKLLKEIEVLTFASNEVYIDNNVRIGMYNIRLILNEWNHADATRLKNYGGFNVRLYEIKQDGLKEINLKKDINFKQNDWAKKNEQNTIRINDLINAILYCKRLDDIKLFN